MRLSMGLAVLSLSCLAGCGGRPGVPPGPTDGGDRDGGGGDAAQPGVCTPGQDQTCNDNSLVSTVWGSCDADGTCGCYAGFAVNPQTGKCRPAVMDAGAAVCTPGQDETCADSDYIPTVAVSCHNDGTCTCSGEYNVNPATGRCRWGTCDLLGQDCPDPTEGCFPPNAIDSAPTPHCAPAGATADGSPCTSDHDCRRGSTCQMYGTTTTVCIRMCDVTAGSGSCPSGQTCGFLWQRAGMPGVCW